MSLQNLEKPNNYQLYIGNAVSPSSTVTNLYPPGIAPNNNITIHGNLITTTDDAVNLGAVGKGFASVYAKNLAGLNGPVNVQYGITGDAGVNPLVIYENGLQFRNGGILGDALSNYYSLSGTINSSGAIVTPVDYSATIIGSLVTLSLKMSIGPCTTIGVPINVQLPSDNGLFPTGPDGVVINNIPVANDVSYPMGSISINSSGLLSIISSLSYESPVYWSLTKDCGLVIEFAGAPTHKIQISYNTN